MGGWGPRTVTQTQHWTGAHRRVTRYKISSDTYCWRIAERQPTAICPNPHRRRSPHRPTPFPASASWPQLQRGTKRNPHQWQTPIWGFDCRQDKRSTRQGTIKILFVFVLKQNVLRKEFEARDPSCPLHNFYSQNLSPFPHLFSNPHLSCSCTNLTGTMAPRALLASVAETVLALPGD